MPIKSENQLLEGEKILFKTTYHWMHFISWQGLFSLFIIPLIESYTDEFIITNKRVIVKKGLIANLTWDLSLQKIETVTVKQSIVGRILQYGGLTIIGTGGTQENISRIKKPINFRKALMKSDLKGN